MHTNAWVFICTAITFIQLNETLQISGLLLNKTAGINVFNYAFSLSKWGFFGCHYTSDPQSISEQDRGPRASNSWAHK